jgi:large subunit ribosomal protein L25
VQAHPWRRNIYHLSFFSVGSHDKVEVTVPLHIVGTPVGVKRDGGALDTVLNELAVSCTADIIPETIEIDVTEMNIGDAIHVADLSLPQGVTAVGEGDRVIVSILGKAAQVTEGEAEEA